MPDDSHYYFYYYYFSGGGGGTIPYLGGYTVYMPLGFLTRWKGNSREGKNTNSNKRKFQSLAFSLYRLNDHDYAMKNRIALLRC